MTNTFRKHRWLMLIGFAYTWFAFGRGDVRAEQDSLQFSPAQGVWDVSGDYPNDDLASTNQITLSQDDKGKITGFGTGFASDSGIDVNLVFNFSGSIKTVSDAVRASLTMKISGTATDGVVILPVKGNIKLALDLDKANNLLIGSGAGNICVQGRCEKISGPVQFDIPQPMDGSWTLLLDYQSPDGKKVSGTATGNLSNGRVIPFAINGSRTTEGLRLNLKGSAGTITFSPPGSHGLGLFILTKAKLLGQTVPMSP